MKLDVRMLQPFPRVTVLPSANSLLTNRVNDTLQYLFPLLEHAARRFYAPVTRLEVSGFVSHEDSTDKIFVTEYVNLPRLAATEYWDQVSQLVEEWTASFPSELAQIANERIAIVVRREQHADA